MNKLILLLALALPAHAQNNSLEMNNAQMTFPNAQRITFFDDSAELIKCGWANGFVILNNGNIVDMFCSISYVAPCVPVELLSVDCGLGVL